MATYIIRHGQTAWNADLRLQGQRDIPLNDLGRQQASENGAVLKRLVSNLDDYDFVSSPLGRARNTMELVRAAAGLDPLAYRLEERLIEICFGEWEGFTNAEIASVDPSVIAAREASKWGFVPPGKNAESYEMLSHRVGSWLRGLDRPTVAVCHGGVIRCLFKLTGTMDSEEAAKLYVPQDKILKYEDGRLAWI